MGGGCRLYEWMHIQSTGHCKHVGITQVTFYRLQLNYQYLSLNLLMNKQYHRCVVYAKVPHVGMAVSYHGNQTCYYKGKHLTSYGQSILIRVLTSHSTST